MINTQMRLYPYFLYEEEDEYGQANPSLAAKGKIKMSINLINQTTVDNINYKDATYLGITMKPIDDTYLIDFKGIKLKVLYVNNIGKYNQVYMAEL